MAGPERGVGDRARQMLQSFAISAAALLLAVACGCLLILSMGKDPMLALRSIYLGSFGSLAAWGETIVKTAPLILTGLAFALSAKCGLLNVGAEGQIYMGGLAATMVALYGSGLPMIIHLPLCLLCGCTAGALWGGLAGWLKVQFQADEMITTIMLNYIATSFANYMVTGILRDPAGTLPQTARVPETARMVQFISGTRIHVGVLLAFLCVGVYFVFLWKTQAGYRTRVVGLSRGAALYAGIDPKRHVVLVMLISGAFSGLAGVCEILGLQIRMMQNFSPGYGFDGIAVAMLGNSTPVGIILSGFMFGGLKAGSNMMQMTTQVPSATISLVQGLVILFVIGSQFLVDWLKRRAMQKRLKGE